MKAEEDPRGPEGPYRFQDRSVPVIVFKRWDGETLIQQLGFTPDPKLAPKQLAQLVDRALKENGPIVPPKALRPLLRAYGKGTEHLGKGRVAPAIREFQAVRKAAADAKKFPEPPLVAADAAARLKELAERASKELDAAREAAPADPEAARREIQRILRDFGALEGVPAAVQAALESLPE